MTIEDETRREHTIFKIVASVQDPNVGRIRGQDETTLVF